MKYIDRAGSPIEEREWYSMIGSLGVGFVQAETTMPHLLGDITIRTVFLGVRGAVPETILYSQDVLPYRTLRLISGRVCWETLETYDEETAARAGHFRWCLRLADPAAEGTT